MATKFKIATLVFKEHITTVQGKKVVNLINRTLKVKTESFVTLN